jgi:hypothetical protein
MIDELEGGGHGVIKALSRHLPEGTGENSENAPSI